MNKFESKFKPGEKVYSIVVIEEFDNSYCQLSISTIESVDFGKDGAVRYWLPDSDGMVEEKDIIKYDKDELFKYLEENLKVQE